LLQIGELVLLNTITDFFCKMATVFQLSAVGFKVTAGVNSAKVRTFARVIEDWEVQHLADELLFL
jgi:hypothetical protein